MTKIAIVYYSMYGHIVKMVDAIAEGVRAVQGVNVEIYQVQETLSEELLKQSYAAPKQDHPIATPQTLKEADGILFGLPTRFGMLPSQVKGLFDSCGGLWATGGLTGKPVGFFFSSGSLGGGQETTVMSTTPFIAHHGMVFVPLGNRTPLLGNIKEVHGGSAWGAGTIAGGDGARQPSELELSIAKVQGESFAVIAKKLAA